MTVSDQRTRVETHVDEAGRLQVTLPQEFANRDVVVDVSLQPSAGRARTREQYRAFISRVFGKSDDPTFVPPPDQPMQPVEAL